MIIYSNRPVNKPSRRARAAERRTTLAAVMLTFSVIVTLATVKRLVDRPGDGGDLSEAAALAYAAVASPGTAAENADETSADGTGSDDYFAITDIIA